jgi:hypothetical protein
MLRQRSQLLLALLLVAASFTAAHAQRARMVYLGNAHVDGANDHDSIKVGRTDGTFRAIQLRVNGGAVNFDRVIIRYGNGTMEEIQVRNRIPDGGRTRIIDLPGDQRIIQSVDIWYSKDRWTRRPAVGLYGIR